MATIINSFSSSLELISSFSGALIVIEHVKPYVKILCEKIFQYETYIKGAFDECRNVLPDQDTLNYLEPTNIAGFDTYAEIEKVKIEQDKLYKRIDDTEADKRNLILDASQSKSLSAISLFLFFSAPLLLILGGCEELLDEHNHLWVDKIRASVSFFCIWSIVYLIAGWLLGDTEKLPKWLTPLCHFSSLRHAFQFFILGVFLSILFVALPLLEEYAYWAKSHLWLTILVYCTLSYLNYAVFAFKIYIKARKLKVTINKDKEELKKECEALNERVDALLNVTKLKNRLQRESTDVNIEHNTHQIDLL